MNHRGDYIRKMSYLLVPPSPCRPFSSHFYSTHDTKKRSSGSSAKKQGEELKDGIIRTAVVAGGAVAAQFVSTVCGVGLYRIFPEGELGSICSAPSFSCWRPWPLA